MLIRLSLVEINDDVKTNLSRKFFATNKNEKIEKFIVVRSLSIEGIQMLRYFVSLFYKKKIEFFVKLHDMFFYPLSANYLNRFFIVINSVRQLFSFFFYSIQFIEIIIIKQIFYQWMHAFAYWLFDLDKYQFVGRNIYWHENLTRGWFGYEKNEHIVTAPHNLLSLSINSKNERRECFSII